MTDAKRVLIVCTGNICRSPFAEAALRRELERRGENGIAVWSAGTGAMEGLPASGCGLSVAREMGVDLSDHRSRRLTPRMIATSDLVLGMHIEHADEVATLVPDAAERTFLFTSFPDKPDPSSFVSDPLGGGEEEYREVYGVIEERAKNLAPLIISYMSDKR